jgi:uncharacterized membrane protein
MRWKLLVLTSLTIGFLSVITFVALNSLFPFYPYGNTRPLILIAAQLIFIVFAAVFVYRRTAKRRKLQALFTAILTAVFSLAILVVVLEASSRVFKSFP